MCELVPQLVQNEAARACSTVLLSIDDSDPVVLPPLWEAVLHVISSIQVSPCGVSDCSVLVTFPAFQVGSCWDKNVNVDPCANRG